MNLSIIIPNYNGESLLRKNLPRVYEAVRNYKKGKVEIIIPNDPCTDDSEKVIADFISGIKDKNIEGKTVANYDKSKSGFSRNVNRGVKLATGDIIILFNSDVVPKENFLNFLLPHFGDITVFAVGLLDESRENDKKVMRGRGIGEWKEGFLIHSRGEVDRNNTLWAAGGSSAFRKEIWDNLGGLEELYDPFYWEDIDLSYKALKAGYKIIFERRSIVVHEHETGAINTNFSKSKIKRTAYRNQFIFVWLNITDPEYVLSHLSWLPYHFINAIKGHDWDFLWGFLMALKMVLKILDKRKTAVKLFKKSDKEVLSQYKQ